MAQRVKSKSRKGQNKNDQNPEVALIAALAAAVLLYMCYFGVIGAFGNHISKLIFGLMGGAAFAAPVVLFLSVCFHVYIRNRRLAKIKIFGGIGLALCLGMIFQLIGGGRETLTAKYGFGVFIKTLYLDGARARDGGGAIVGLITKGIFAVLGNVGTITVIVFLFIISVLAITGASFAGGVKKIKDYKEHAEERARNREEEETQNEDGHRRGGRKDDKKSGFITIKDSVGTILDNRGITAKGDAKVSQSDIASFLANVDLREEKMPIVNTPEWQEWLKTRSDMVAGRIVNGQSVILDADTNVEDGVFREIPENFDLLESGAAQNQNESLLARIKGKMVESAQADLLSRNEADAAHIERLWEEKATESGMKEISFAFLEKDFEEADKGRDITAKFAKDNPYDKEEILPIPAFEIPKPISESEDSITSVIHAKSIRTVPQEQKEPLVVLGLIGEASDLEHEDTKEDIVSNAEFSFSIDGAANFYEELLERNEVKESKPLDPLPEADELHHILELPTKVYKKGGADSKSVNSSDVPQKRKNKPYNIPNTGLLNEIEARLSKDAGRQLKETAKHLESVLDTFGVTAKVTEISRGPTVTRFELQPDTGVKVSKIVSLEDDIKLNLAATDIRLEAPIPGKAAIGIEIPNKEITPVSLKGLIASKEFQRFPSDLAFAVGKDIAGQIVVWDIAKMPHMLIAGATGSGKSVCINTLIMSILYKADPEQVKLIMIDPKVVELSVYNGIPHLLAPVVTEARMAANTLHWAVAQMLERYNKFEKHKVRNLEGFNEKVTKGMIEEVKLPKIVIIVDELADLMMVASKEVEESICRLAQLARAAGIHLIIATQRPSVDVITGLIKANMPSRLAFAVSSGVDSRTILDKVGAEKLLGKGDMLFYPQGYSKPARLQGAFVSDEEVTRVVEYIKGDYGEAQYDELIREKISAPPEAAEAALTEDDGRDPLFRQAGIAVINNEKGTIGMLQRVLKIGFNRAARIMDQLAEYGVVGEEEGTKPRKVLMNLYEFEELLRK